MKKLLASILGLGLSASLLTATPAQAVDPNDYPETCYGQHKQENDCTEAMNYESSGPTWRAYIRMYRNRDQQGMSIVLYPGDHTRHYAGRSDWDSVRVPKGTKVVKVVRVNRNTGERFVYRWYPFGIGGGKGKMNLRDGRYEYYFKIWRPKKKR